MAATAFRPDAASLPRGLVLWLWDLDAIIANFKRISVFSVAGNLFIAFSVLMPWIIKSLNSMAVGLCLVSSMSSGHVERRCEEKRRNLLKGN